MKKYGLVLVYVYIVSLILIIGSLVFFKTELLKKEEILNKTSIELTKAKTEIQNLKATKELSLPKKYVGEFLLTHYCPCQKCTGKKDRSRVRTATGSIPREGRTVAVDPKVIPLHSVIFIEGLGYYVTEDVGGGVKGNKIDIFVNSHEKALKLGTLGNKKRKVYLLNYKK